MTKSSDRRALPNLGRRPPFMGFLSCFDTFARHELFDETAYALSSRLCMLFKVLRKVLSNDAFDAYGCCMSGSTAYFQKP
jgi:hypothetical protein